jgi:hypothetical protein
LFDGGMQSHKLADQHEIEELREQAITLGFDDVNRTDDFHKDLLDNFEALRDLWMLEFMSKKKGLEDLTSHVTVLTPTGNLVVSEFGNLMSERCDLCILVELRFPEFRRETARAISTVNNWQRPTETTRKPASKILLGNEFVTSACRLESRRTDPLPCTWVHADAFEEEQDWNR